MLSRASGAPRRTVSRSRPPCPAFGSTLVARQHVTVLTDVTEVDVCDNGDAKKPAFYAWCDTWLLLKLVGRRTRNAQVIGSSPIAGSTIPLVDADFLVPPPEATHSKKAICVLSCTTRSEIAERASPCGTRWVGVAELRLGQVHRKAHLSWRSPNVLLVPVD